VREQAGKVVSVIGQHGT